MNFFRKVKLFSQMAAGDFRFVFFGPPRLAGPDLEFRGKITGSKTARDPSRNAVKTVAAAEMSLVNPGPDTLVLLNPKYLSQPNAKDFALTEEDSRSKTHVWISAPTSDEPVIGNAFNELLGRLEDRSPIEDLTVVLTPGERFEWRERVFFEFDTTPKKKRWEEIGWDEFRKKGDRFWLRFIYRVPEEMYLLKPKLIEACADCWKGLNEVPLYCLQGKNTNRKFFELETPPMLIDFDRAAGEDSL